MAFGPHLQQRTETHSEARTTLTTEWGSICQCRSDYVTCDLSFLDGERDDQVKRSQPCHIQTVHSHWSVCCLGDRG